MLDDRKLEVLRAVVEDFVATQEPVGSKGLVERHDLGVSPATVRNDMAVLEDQGLIVQPHTSAGRVPTDRGYRLFVDRLSGLKPLSAPERRAVTTFLEGAVDLDDVVARTVRLLAQLTRQVAVVQYPSLTRSRVRHLELVATAPDRLLLVLITDTGRVEQRQVQLAEPCSEGDVAELRGVLNSRLVGDALADASTTVADLADSVVPRLRAVAVGVVATLLETLVERREERVAIAGTPSLAAAGPADWPRTMRPVLEAIEEQVVLLTLLAEASDPSTVLVRIGEEMGHEALRDAAVVSVGYGADGTAVAGLGVLGPTRMDYPGVMQQVGAVARYVGRVLAQA